MERDRNNNNNINNIDTPNIPNAPYEGHETSLRIDTLNQHFDFFGFINSFFSEAEKALMASNYLNKPRFSSVFSYVTHLNYLYLMGFLNYQSDNGNGIKETLRAIELKKAKLVYVAVDCEIQDY